MKWLNDWFRKAVSDLDLTNLRLIMVGVCERGGSNPSTITALNEESSGLPQYPEYTALVIDGLDDDDDEQEETQTCPDPGWSWFQTADPWGSYEEAFLANTEEVQALQAMYPVHTEMDVWTNRYGRVTLLMDSNVNELYRRQITSTDDWAGTNNHKHRLRQTVEAYCGLGDLPEEEGYSYPLPANPIDCWSDGEMLGDANSDGTLDILDIVIMVNNLLGGIACAVCDVNTDGTLNVLDIVQAINFILGIER